MKNLRMLPILAGLFAVACLAVCALTQDTASFVTALSLSALGAAFAMKDALLKVTKALPNGAASITSSGIDLGKGSFDDFVADCEVLLTVPALTTTQLPDTRTMTYILEHDTDAAFGTVATLNVGSVVQTGAGGAGAAATTMRVRLPTNVKRYIRAKATGGASAGDCTAASLTMEVLF